MTAELKYPVPGHMEHQMNEPTIQEINTLALAGFNFFGDPFRSSAGWTEENEIGRTWQRLMSFLEDPKNQLPPLRMGASYEVHLLHPDSMKTGEFEVFAGIELAIPDPQDCKVLLEVPAEMCIKILPASTCAVFTLAGAEITSDWQKNIQEWMLSSGYSESQNYSFQRYDERFRGMDHIEHSVIEVWIPVKRNYAS